MKILAAMEIADCDFEHMDMDVLVGALLKLKLWVDLPLYFQTPVIT
ncbi:hypothetical protein H1B53_22610 [Salmonella enterica subsp. enterica serovar Indiana]|nr:hypothetical protein [Salmonella enterica subsp. enterica serovar Indiana]